MLQVDPLRLSPASGDKERVLAEAPGKGDTATQREEPWGALSRAQPLPSAPVNSCRAPAGPESGLGSLIKEKEKGAGDVPSWGCPSVSGGHGGQPASAKAPATFRRLSALRHQPCPGTPEPAGTPPGRKGGGWHCSLRLQPPF